MKRLKVLAPLWGLRDFRRFHAQYKALSDHVDLQFVYYYPGLAPDVDWASFKKVPPPYGDLLRFEDLVNFIKKVLMTVDDFDVIYTRSRASRRQFTDVILKEMARKPLVMLGQACAADVRKINMHRHMDIMFANTLGRLTLQLMDRIVPLSQKVREYLLR